MWEVLLQAKDKRYEKRLQIKIDMCTGIELSSILPGWPKIEAGLMNIFDFTLEQLRRKLNARADLVLGDEAGLYAFLQSQTAPIEAKLICMEIEDSFIWGRLLDVDVHDLQTRSILNRRQLAISQRKCLLCDKDHDICMRGKHHTLSDLRAEAHRRINIFKDTHMININSIEDIIANGPSTVSECLAIWEQQDGNLWKEVEDLHLGQAINSALQHSTFFATKSLPPAFCAGSSLERARHMPILTKLDYWHHGKELRLPNYDTLTTLRFHTSGTELGEPTEQPWDDWTFTRSFCESSAIALARAGISEGDGVIVGSPMFGALARSYKWAADLLHLEIHADEQSFSDDELFCKTLAFAKKSNTTTLVATPGGVALFYKKCSQLGVDTRNIGIKRVVSGIGNFLSERHIRLIVDAFRPDIIIEQGGKNEILHAPGGIRYNALAQHKVCEDGYLHYLPYVSSVQTVLANAYDMPMRAVEDNKGGLLLMSRLCAGREGVVSFLNDAGDFGSVRRFGVGSEKACCTCGSTLPAFKYLGRVGGSLTNKLGDTLFNEEFNLALSAACQALNIPVDVASETRIQIVLLRQESTEAPDILCWIIGVPEGAMHLHAPLFKKLRTDLIQYWVSYNHYDSGQFSAYMILGEGVLVGASAMPHAGRDKPQYKLNALIKMKDGANIQHELSRHLQSTLNASPII